ncbi:DUF624 domain-containing protein [Marinilactibacillus sp. XAAS-LB27]|uniref:YesL family protein n=1 Tax=Marinilactibacillus sp. XAAS-LB27 TaxID=3114538 RepID=UPI002E17B343|nr:DUF624 domain-containing protein [Marinilactibacillus sp. XAAS-LB27]
MKNVEKLNMILTRVLKLTCLNFLWMIGTMMGLGILGIGPSTAATFSVIREWLRGNDDLPLIKTFIAEYKRYFKKSNLLSLIYMVAGIILIMDYIYASRWELRVVFGVLIFLYTISVTYIFPVLVHYELKSLKEMIRYSFLIGFSYLQYTLVLFVSILAIYSIVARVYPALVTFFGTSFLIFIVMKMAYMVFARIERSVNESEAVKN